MRSSLLSIVLLLSALVFGACAEPQVIKDPTPVKVEVPPPPPFATPETARQDVTDTLFGQPVPDPYRWLEDGEDAKVQAWMGAQDKVTRSYLDGLEGREALEKRLTELFYVDSISAPEKRGGRFFYSRRHADKEKRVWYWKEGEKGKEVVLLDPNTMSEDGSVSVSGVVPSWDGKKVAYQRRLNNADEATLHVMDVVTGKELEQLTGAKYATPNWTPKGDAFYYVYLPDDPAVAVSDRPGTAEVRYHVVGKPQTEDVLIKDKTGDPSTFLSVSLSRDGKWLMYYVWRGWNASDVYFREAKKPVTTKWTPLVVGKDAIFGVEVWKDQFYILTNHEAPRYKVMRTTPKKFAFNKWETLVPEDAQSVIDSLQVIGQHLVVSRLQNAATSLEVRKLDGKLVRKVELPTIGATSGMTGDPGDDDAYFSFQSFTVPPQIYRTSIKKGGPTLWAEVKVPIDPTPYSVEQVWYPSKDGTKVSMFIVRPKDKPLDGTMPFLLSGYGGFSVSMQPWFRASIYPWLEQGGGFAVPNLRGGGEYGEAWHRAGMGLNKQNVFDDFIGAAEYLVKEGYTTAGRLGIRGGSNGGLLVGAAMTQRPDLFGAVICEVPLLDMVRYHLFGSGKTWIPEYGSAEDEAQFKALLAYSPYHHVSADATYPPLLMLSADSDDRVDPLHARKFVAAVQAVTQGRSPAYLRIERNAGHGGADQIKAEVVKGADIYTFLRATLAK